MLKAERDEFRKKRRVYLLKPQLKMQISSSLGKEE